MGTALQALIWYNHTQNMYRSTVLVTGVSASYTFTVIKTFNMRDNNLLCIRLVWRSLSRLLAPKPFPKKRARLHQTRIIILISSADIFMKTDFKVQQFISKLGDTSILLFLHGHI